MIKVIYSGDSNPSFRGGCEKCGAYLECRKEDTIYSKYNVDSPWTIRCPECNSIVSVFPAFYRRTC